MLTPAIVGKRNSWTPVHLVLPDKQQWMSNLKIWINCCSQLVQTLSRYTMHCVHLQLFTLSCSILPLFCYTLYHIYSYWIFSLYSPISFFNLSTCDLLPSRWVIPSYRRIKQNSLRHHYCWDSRRQPIFIVTKLFVSQSHLLVSFGRWHPANVQINYRLCNSYT